MAPRLQLTQAASITRNVLLQVAVERVKQDKRWGVQPHSREKWFTILLEELGEAAEASLNDASSKFIHEMTQVAAVAVAAIECELKRNQS